MKRILPIGLALSSLLLVGVGCDPLQSAKDKVAEKIAEKAVEKTIERAIEKSGAKNVDVDLDKKGFTYKDEKTGQVFSMGDNVTIPDSFPSDMPRYPGTTPKSVTLNDDKHEAGLVLEVDARLDAVVTWYKDEAVKAGWTSSSSYDTAQTKILSFERTENGGTAKLNVSISNTSSDGKTSIIMGRNGVKK